MTTSPVTSASKHLTASGAVFDVQRGKVLLVLHRASGFWQFPGGHVEENEPPHLTALREVHEETDIHATLFDPAPFDAIPGTLVLPSPFLVAQYVAPAKPAKGEPEHTHVDLLYLMVTKMWMPLPQVAEVSAAGWFGLDEVDAATEQIRPDIPQITELAWAQVSRLKDTESVR